MLSVHVNAAGNGDWYNATGWSAWTTKGQNNSDKLADCLYEAAEELLKPLGKKLRYDMTDGDKDFEVHVGDRVAQGVFMKYLTIDNEEKIDKKRTGGMGYTNKKEKN